MTQGIPNIAATEKVRHAALQEAARMVWQTSGKIANGEFVPFSCDRCGAVHYGLWTSPMRCTCGNIKRADRCP